LVRLIVKMVLQASPRKRATLRGDFRLSLGD
jgi:hypothetical protein